MFSVIIPTCNSSSTIKKALEAIYRQEDIKADELEVLVVDDCSNDNTTDIVKGFPARLFSLDKNSGPAMARNFGARQARGDIIIFIDSDVILKDGALLNIKKSFQENPEIAGLAGIYAKQPGNSGPFRDYLALRKYSNWFDPRQKFISFLVVSLGAIKKEIFLEHGGFDTKYRGADVEDFELGYRITKKYKILLADNVQGYHFFPGFPKTVQNFFKRTFQWVELFTRLSRFSTEAATTKKRAVANILGFFSLILVIFSYWFPLLFSLSILCFLFFLWGNIRFYRFALTEKGPLFLLYGVVIDYILAIVVVTAAILSILNRCRLNVIHK